MLYCTCRIYKYIYLYFMYTILNTELIIWTLLYDINLRYNSFKLLKTLNKDERQHAEPVYQHYNCA